MKVGGFLLLFNAFQIPTDLANNRNRVENDTSIEV